LRRAVSDLTIEKLTQRGWLEKLDDRFHETGIHGTGDLLADSLFAIG
jgi:hypothetical protein